MQSKAIAKRTLPVIIVLIVIIGIAVSCTLLQNNRVGASITDKNGKFVEVTENGKTYYVTNETAYKVLKARGIVSLTNLVDEKILDSEKNSDGKSYLQLAKELPQNEYDAFRNEYIYGEDYEDLTDEEKEEKLKVYEESAILNGFPLGSQAEKNYFYLEIAKKLYSYDKFIVDTAQVAEDYKVAYDLHEQYTAELAELKEQDTTNMSNRQKRKLEKSITDMQAKIDEQSTKMSELSYVASETAITSYYNKNYNDEFWAIIIAYPSKLALENALKQIGIKSSSTSESLARWVWTSGGDEHKDENGTYRELNSKEVLAAYIQLYNNANAHKLDNYPTSTLSIPSDIELYNIVDDGFVSDVRNSAFVQYRKHILYTYDELNAVSTTLRSQISSWTSFVANTPEETPSEGYYRNGLLLSTKYYLALKLDVDKKTEIENVKEEIITKIIDEKFDTDSNNVIKEKMADLRKEYKLLIHDPKLETDYQAGYDSDFESTKIEDRKNVASYEINGQKVYVSADALFADLSVRYGFDTAVQLINYERMLSSGYNEIYTYTSASGKVYDKKNVLDKEAYQKLLASVSTEKQYFSGGGYEYYNYPATYGWQEFINDWYLNYGLYIQDEKELVFYFMYNEALTKYKDELNLFTQLGEKTIKVDQNQNVTVSDDPNSELSKQVTELWKRVKAEMDRIYNDYYSVSGIHLLINVTDDTGTIVDPEEWTDYQIEKAAELYAHVLAYLDSRPNTEKSTSFERIVEAYENAPYLLADTDYNQTTNNILLSQPKLDGSAIPFGNDMVSLGDSAYVLAYGNTFIPLSVYKSAGLSVKYENLGSFKNGPMAAEFDAVARKLWSESSEYYDEEEGGERVYYGGVRAEDGDYLVTEFGYHIYVQTAVYNRTTVTIAETNEDKDEVKGQLKAVQVPTLEQIIELVSQESSDDANLTTYEKKCISEFYDPAATEITGGTYRALQMIYKQLELAKSGNVTFNFTPIEGVTYEKVLDFYVEYLLESLAYTVEQKTE